MMHLTNQNQVLWRGV